MEKIFRCSKARSGEMEYAIDCTQEYVRIIEDYPASQRGNGTGGKFKDERVSFADINSCLSRGEISSTTLTNIFVSKSVTNGAMLLGALLHLGCVTGKEGAYKQGTVLSASMQLP